MNPNADEEKARVAVDAAKTNNAESSLAIEESENPTYLAWASIGTEPSKNPAHDKGYVEELFQPVHQMAIEIALSPLLEKFVIRNEIKTILKAMQSVTDENQTDQWLHAMYTRGEQRHIAINKANAFVHDMLKLFGSDSQDLLAGTHAPSLKEVIENIEKEVGEGALRKVYDNIWFYSENLIEPVQSIVKGLLGRFVIIGIVMHMMQDATSPSHIFFQQWYPLDKKANPWLALKEEVKHILLENKYPDSGSDEAIFLEGATRWCWDLFMKNTKQPNDFFDSEIGVLMVDEDYLIKGKVPQSPYTLAKKIFFNGKRKLATKP